MHETHTRYVEGEDKKKRHNKHKFIGINVKKRSPLSEHCFPFMTFLSLPTLLMFHSQYILPIFTEL